MIRLSCLLLFLPLACATPPTAAPRDISFDAHGGRLHYQVAGRGEPAIVLVHGWASDTRAWHHQFPSLANLGRLVVVDLPGHGGSSIPEEYSMSRFADAIAAVLDNEGIQSAVLVAHSNGAPVALNFHARHPERTAGLLFVDGQVKSMFSKQAAEGMFAPFMGEDWQGAMSAMIKGMPAPNLLKGDLAGIESMALSQAHETVVGAFYAALEPDAFPGGSLSVPVRYLMTAGPAWTAEYKEFAAELAPHSEYIEVPDSGHYLQMEQPGLLRETLEQLLAAIAQTSL